MSLVEPVWIGHKSVHLLDRSADVLALPCDVTNRTQLNQDGAGFTLVKLSEARPKDVCTSVDSPMHRP
ncbi:MAG TPA: hypothetical protein V6C91_12035 [Coleofasciculaceae cyanobacterium]